VNKIRYDITQITSGSIYPENLLDNNQSKVVDSFEINSKFTSNKNFVRLEICSLDNIPVVIDTDFTDYSLLYNAQSAGTSGASVVTVDPVKDIKSNSLEGSDLILKYRFLDNLFTAGKTGGNLFVKQISPDRKELKLLSKDLTDEEINNYASSYSKEIAKSNTFNEFYLVAGETFINLLNIKAENNSVIVKLNSALPSNINVNTLVNVLEEISNPQVFECISEVVQEKEKLKRLKGPNFSLEVNDKLTNTTEFLNYNELFSYPVSSSYYELYSLFNEKSAQIAIDHTDYKDFIHFSSAEERLRNFKYKLDLLHSYEDSSYSASLSGLNLPGISGSTTYYDNLIQGVVNNFDHYDRYLYYESSSYSWPKLTSTRPYSTQKSTTSESVSWYSKQLNSASNYDVSNFDLLTNTIPTYIREDSNNEPYLMFVHMIAQHFDNLWIYFKAVSDKYDADNRLNFGVSKDLVKDAIESFGIKLYDSNASLENLFSSYLGEAYNTGSEYITSTVVAASGSNSHLQPIPKDSYQKEVYKRIYHNLPFLIKTKGTQRGLRALINCYGIPDNILDIRTSPGVKPGTDDFFGPTPFLSQSKVAIRLDNTGSIVTGSALSAFSTVVNKNNTYSNDSHEVHVGFNINSDTNKVIRNRTTGSFNIDNYIGDPRIESDARYDSLNIVSKKILEEDITWEDMTSAWEDSNFNWNDDLAFNRSPNGFVRLLKFFDNSLFKQIKDFLPARTVTATGLIIEPHVLNRSKITAPSVSFTNDIYSSSISISTVTGSDGGSFPYAAKQTYTTDYSSSIVSPLGRVKRDVTGEEVRITGEYSGSFLIVQDGELNKSNNLKKSAQPLITMDLTALFQSDPIPPSCTISLQAEYLGDYYRILSAGTGSGDISQTYPSAIGATGSLGLVHDYDTFEFFTLQATATYPYTFDGWYTGSSGAGSLITTSSTLTVDRLDESVHGNVYYARFN
jgi:hypothetical protein